MSVLEREPTDLSARRRLSQATVLDNSAADEFPRSANGTTSPDVGVARFIGYGNIGVLTAAVDIAVITASGLIATVVYHLVAMGEATWLLTIGAHSGLL